MMFNIAEIVDNPYKKIVNELVLGEYIIKIEGKYKDASPAIIFSIECGIGSNFSRGTVDMNISVDKFISEGILSFAYLEVPCRIQRLGIGSMLMQVVIEIAKELRVYFKVTSHKIQIRGWLSNVDYKNGNWERALPFYQKTAKINNVEVLFIGEASEQTYKRWQDYLIYEADKDGKVIFNL